MPLVSFFKTPFPLKYLPMSIYTTNKSIVIGVYFRIMPVLIILHCALGRGCEADLLR